MNTKNRVMTLLALSSSAAAATALINKYVKLSSTSKGLLTAPHSLCFKWRLGNIHYTKAGSGKPLLLIHDLNFASSGYEWSQVSSRLAEHYTVYTIDLLGCGRSEKPNLTYTNYLYVQLLNDFIKSEIGHRTDVIATGASCALTIMTCSNSADLFDRIMLINPESLLSCAQVPGKNTKLYKFILDTPILGTLLYNIAASHSFIQRTFCEHYFSNPYSVKPIYIDHYAEAAHLGGCPKAIFSSLECGYTKCNITAALRKIDNSIYIVGGGEINHIKETAEEYKSYNCAIETSIIAKAKHLPQLELPDKMIDLITMFFS